MQLSKFHARRDGQNGSHKMTCEEAVKSPEHLKHCDSNTAASSESWREYRLKIKQKYKVWSKIKWNTRLRFLKYVEGTYGVPW